MPGMSGFEMLDLLPQINFNLIVTTSDDKFAVQALRFSAIDFLLKPVKPTELKDAVQRCIEKSASPSKKQIHLLQENMSESHHHIKKNFFLLHHSCLVNLQHVSKFVKCDGGYVVLENSKTITVSRNRKEAFLEALSKL